MRTFRRGDRARVKGGPHASFTGRAEGIDQSRAPLKIAREVLSPKRAGGPFAPERVSIKFAGAEEVSPA